MKEYDNETYLHDVASFMLTQKVEKEFAHQEGLEEGLAKGKAMGIEEGLAKGKVMGIEEGKAKKSKEIAQNMISLGLPNEIIAQSTGLTPDEIDRLRHYNDE